MSNRSAQESLKCLTQCVQLVNKAEEICQAMWSIGKHNWEPNSFLNQICLWRIWRSVAFNQTGWYLLQDPTEKFNQFHQSIVVKMSEYSEIAYLHTVRSSTRHLSHFLLSLRHPISLYLPVSMLQWRPSKVHASVTMAMTWNWKENKVGFGTKKKKDKRREVKCTKTQRDTQQHKHRSKWLILCTTEFKGNEDQHKMWIKYASEN